MSITSKCFAGGVGCGIAGFLTNPADVIKVRNQQFTESKYLSFQRTFTTILNEEGVRGFYKGAAASVLRECTYSALRMGLYERPSNHIAVAECTSTVFFVVTCISHNLYGEGMEGFVYRTSATVTRAAFLTSAQLGSYDIIKNNIFVQMLGFDKEANSTHFSASMIASVITTTAANPADVVKTRVMNDPHATVGGPSQHLAHIWKTNGVGGFTKGWTASYLRIGPHTVISLVLVLIEKVRQLIVGCRVIDS